MSDKWTPYQEHRKRTDPPPYGQGRDDTAVVEWTGEVIPLHDPGRVVGALNDIRALEVRAKELKRVLSDALADHARVQGTKTLHLNGRRVTLKGGPASETVWDIEVLGELRKLGLPEQRWAALVKTTIEYKVDAAVAKQLAAVNEDYRRVIEAAQTKIDKPWYVS